jgi:hypothetical protein
MIPWVPLTPLTLLLLLVLLVLVLLVLLMMLLGRTMLVPPRASPASPVLLRLRGGCSGVKASPE